MSTSIWPNKAKASFTLAFSTSWELVTSSCSVAESGSPCRAANDSGLRAVAMTLSPRLRTTRASCNPRPAELPVMSHTFGEVVCLARAICTMTNLQSCCLPSRCSRLVRSVRYMPAAQHRSCDEHAGCIFNPRNTQAKQVVVSPGLGCKVRSRISASTLELRQADSQVYIYLILHLHTDTQSVYSRKLSSS